MVSRNSSVRSHQVTGWMTEEVGFDSRQRQVSLSCSVQAVAGAHSGYPLGKDGKEHKAWSWLLAPTRIQD
jgi:hypothetical protein